MTELTYKQKYYQENKQKWVDWANKNRERKNENSRRSAKNRKEQRFKNNCNWIENNYEKKMLQQSKKNALYKNLEFNLELADIVIPETCPYLDVKLTKTQGIGRVDTNASLDRIDSNRGYTKDNIEVISFKANLIKRDASITELQIFAQNILRKFPC